MKLLLLLIVISTAYAVGLGGFKEIDISKPEDNDRASEPLEFGIQEFIKETNADPSLKLSKINHVYTKVVNGLLWKYDVELTDSTGKLINIELVVAARGSKPTKLMSHEIKESPTIVGGFKEIDISEADARARVSEPLEFGIKEFISQTNADSSLKLSKINHVYNKVVNGLLWKYDVELIDNTGKLTNVELTVAARGTKPTKLANFELKSSPVRLGGFKEFDVSEVEENPILGDLLKFAINEFIAQAKVDSNLKLAKINHVYKKVVAGLQLKFDVELTDKSGKSTFVDLVAVTQPWLKKREFNSYEIKNAPEL